jgi:hypothetical protein
MCAGEMAAGLPLRSRLFLPDVSLFLPDAPSSFQMLQMLRMLQDIQAGHYWPITQDVCMFSSPRLLVGRTVTSVSLYVVAHACLHACMPVVACG